LQRGFGVDGLGRFSSHVSINTLGGFGRFGRFGSYTALVGFGVNVFLVFPLRLILHC
jgi:hypothetical protein